MECKGNNNSVYHILRNDFLISNRVLIMNGKLQRYLTINIINRLHKLTAPPCRDT